MTRQMSRYSLSSRSLPSFVLLPVPYGVALVPTVPVGGVRTMTRQMRSDSSCPGPLPSFFFRLMRAKVPRTA